MAFLKRPAKDYADALRELGFSDELINNLIVGSAMRDVASELNGGATKSVPVKVVTRRIKDVPLDPADREVFFEHVDPEDGLEPEAKIAVITDPEYVTEDQMILGLTSRGGEYHNIVLASDTALRLARCIFSRFGQEPPQDTAETAPERPKGLASTVFRRN